MAERLPSLTRVKLAGDFRSGGAQVLGIKNMRRDPLFWGNPSTDAPTFSLVRHVRALFRAVKGESSWGAIYERPVILRSVCFGGSHGAPSSQTPYFFG